jgi:hypothetical protein
VEATRWLPPRGQAPVDQATMAFTTTGTPRVMLSKTAERC